jgi:hypothetical protein
MRYTEIPMQLAAQEINADRDHNRLIQVQVSNCSIRRPDVRKISSPANDPIRVDPDTRLPGASGKSDVEEDSGHGERNFPWGNNAFK